MFKNKLIIILSVFVFIGFMYFISRTSIRDVSSLNSDLIGVEFITLEKGILIDYTDQDLESTPCLEVLSAQGAKVFGTTQEVKKNDVIGNGNYIVLDVIPKGSLVTVVGIREERTLENAERFVEIRIDGYSRIEKIDICVYNLKMYSDEFAAMSEKGKVFIKDRSW
ncbi:MAG: hypothetical protein GX765_04880 [Candidatus Moranbacteria bacterium]|nr:hypothetical protein [Candidatus Moranbacteria bacterium]